MEIRHCRNRTRYTLLFTVASLFITCCLLIPVTGFSSESEIPPGPSVLFISPGNRDDIFFSRMESFMEAAAKDLNIDLEVLYGERNYATTIHVVNQVLSRKKLPQYLVLVNENDMGRLLLPGLSGRGVRIILINEGIAAKDSATFGRPGQKYRNWFAEFLPDDLHAGYLLADELIRARLKQGDKDINIVGLSGTVKTTSSSLRVKGLDKAANRYRQVKILQVVPAFYDIERAEHVTTGLLARYRNTDIVWAASDGMAVGAALAMRENGKKPGTDCLTGGIDWTNLSFDMVTTGTFTATVGGHFMDGAWALVMIYDDYNGYKGPFPKRSYFAVINRENIHRFYPFFMDNQWDDIDFRHFSMILNPDQKQYDFSFSAVLEQLNKNKETARKPGTTSGTMQP